MFRRRNRPGDRKRLILKAQAVEQCGEEPSRFQKPGPEAEHLIHTAMDGKTLRGTLKHAKEGQPPVHLLSLYECQSGIVLTQRAVKSKENEITAAGALLHPLLIKGRIISTDAMHTQKKWCAGVDGYSGIDPILGGDSNVEIESGEIIKSDENNRKDSFYL